MRTSAFLSTLALAATVSAQTIVPAAAATVRPTLSPFYTSDVLYSTSSTTTAHDSRTQSIIATSDIAMPTAVWNSLAVRRPVGLGNANDAFTANATIILSTSSVASNAVSTTFASNHGSSPTTVLSGSISLPAAVNQATWPAPWQAPFLFTTPFVFVQASGQSLVIDILQTGHTATTSWYVELTSPDNGGRFANGAAPSTCKNSSGTYASGLGYNGTIIPGSSWYVNYSGLKPSAPGFGWIGTQGVGGTWAGLPLPVDLSPFGAPGCNIFASIDYSTGMTASATGSATWPTITIPNNPGLAGLSFYDHSAWLDAAANAFGIVVGWSSRWGIGTQLGAPGSLVRVTGNAAAAGATGTILKGSLPTFQLNP